MRDCERIWINADPASLAGPSVIVANHLSSFDVIILLGLTPDLVLVANRRVLRLPLLGTLARDAGHLAAGPGENQSLITAGLARLRQGISVALFPEGTRSRDGEIHRFHNGAFTLAQAAKCDIVPVLLTNTHACVYPHTRWLGYHRCIVRILPRISPATHAGVSPRALARRVRDLMAGYRPGDWRRSQEGPSFPRYIRSLYNYQSFKVQREVKRQLRSDPACAEIDALVPASGMVLVISCGYGVVCHILARKSPERQVLGVDSDPQRIAIAQSSALAIGRARFESIDARTWNWPPADCVVLLEGLRPWPQSDWPKMISSLAQSLCPQGTLIVPRNDSCLALLGEHKLSPARPSSGEAASSSSFVVVRLADN